MSRQFIRVCITEMKCKYDDMNAPFSGTTQKIQKLISRIPEHKISFYLK
jgi:hypothetical protein